MNEEDNDFISLAWLHFEQRIGIGALATAIENHGVWGWDRFERWRRFDKDSEEQRTALNRLARQCELNAQSEPAAPDLDPTSDPLFFFGWLAADLPDFAADVVSAPQVPKRRGDIARVANTDLTIIGAMLFTLEGKLGCARHPRFSSTAQIIEHIEHHMKGYPGVSKRTLEDRFSRARKLIDNPR